MKHDELGTLNLEAAPAGPCSEQAIQEQLNRILDHHEFQATEKLRHFLRFIVEETLAGRSRQLKGFTIATEVYGRDETFDPEHDPVVRIQAGRLRRALERYYLVAGGDDPVYISIPKGAYVPVFTRVTPASSPGAAAQADVYATGGVRQWPSVLICPFRNMTGDAELTHLGPGLATELCIELSRYQEIRVMMLREGLYGGRSVDSYPLFTIDGNIRADQTTVKVTVQLFESGSGEQLWVESFTSGTDLHDMIAFEEHAANIIAAQVASNHGIITRKLSPKSRLKPISDLTTYQAILKGYAYDQAISTASYLEALKALRSALDKDPQCGVCAGMLAFLYADNIAFEFLDLDQTPFVEAVILAQQGVLLEPNNQLNRLALAMLRMLDNELDLAMSEVESALALNPNSLMYMELIGYFISLLGEWDRGTELIRTAIRLNPFHRINTRYAIWTDCIRRQDYVAAWEETEMLLGTGDFWAPLSRATTAGLLGRLDEGKAAVAELLTLKPEFRERGRILIGHGIKFEDITSRLEEGLANCGLKIK